MTNSAIQQIKNIAKSSSSMNAQIETIYIIMKEFGWTIFEVQEVPLPTMQILVELMKKEARRNNKKSNKRNR